MAAEVSPGAQCLLLAPGRLGAQGEEEAADPSPGPFKDTDTTELHRDLVE